MLSWVMKSRSYLRETGIAP
ncbi:hypothetical protein LINPERPRIM_LOCUS9511 [Linum perenne]